MASSLHATHLLATAARALRGALAIALAPLAVSLAPAQDATPWTSGTPLRATAAASGGTTATLSLTMGERPGNYLLSRNGPEITFRLMTLSGEREIPFTVAETTTDKNVFEGRGYRLTVQSVDPYTTLAEFETLEQTRGIAYMVVSSEDNATSTQLLQNFSGVRLDLPGTPIYLQSAGGQTFRNIRRDMIELLSPMDPRTKVRFSISTQEKTRNQIGEPRVGAMLRPETDAPDALAARHEETTRAAN